MLDPGEECDDGNLLGHDGCSPTCTFEFCGDGELQCSEECDDGNNEDGDGCSARCVTEGDPEDTGTQDTGADDTGSSDPDDGGGSEGGSSSGGGSEGGSSSGGGSEGGSSGGGSEGGSSSGGGSEGGSSSGGGSEGGSSSGGGSEGGSSGGGSEGGSSGGGSEGGSSSGGGSEGGSSGGGSEGGSSSGGGSEGGSSSGSDGGGTVDTGIDPIDTGIDPIDTGIDPGDTGSGGGDDGEIVAVCGDGWVDGDETCDDLNTVSGDGCSANCEVEFCGPGDPLYDSMLPDTPTRMGLSLQRGNEARGVTVGINNALPGQVVWFLASPTYELGGCPWLFVDACLELEAPELIGYATVDGTGSAEVDAVLPEGLDRYYVQAAVMGVEQPFRSTLAAVEVDAQGTVAPCRELTCGEEPAPEPNVDAVCATDLPATPNGFVCDYTLPGTEGDSTVLTCSGVVPGMWWPSSPAPSG